MRTWERDHHQLTADNIAAGREWLQAHVYHMDPDLTLTGEQVRAKVDILYVGGWRVFCEERQP